MSELNLARHLLAAANSYSDKTAIVDGEHAATYGEHIEASLRLANGVRDRLSGADEPFAVLSLNSARYQELYHASFFGAGVMTPLNLRLAPAELAFVLNDANIRVCFVDETFAPLIDKIRTETALEHVVGLQPEAPHVDEVIESVYSDSAALPGGEPSPDQTTLLMYTGGTTGKAKGVALHHEALTLSLYHTRMVVPCRDDEIHLAQAPMFHGAALFGFLVAPTVGATVVTIPAFDPDTVGGVIKSHHVTHTVMVPTMVGMMLNSDSFDPTDLESLRTLVYGASPMPPALLDTLGKIAPDLEFYQAYGLTEAAPLLTVLTAEDHRRDDLLTSAGRAVPGVDIEIRDVDSGEALPTGEVGEIVARGGNIMKEYYNRPEETAGAIRDGWFHTGDAGRLDENDYLFLVDRVKDMIKTGGENVYSVEVEKALSEHPAVIQCAVIGVPHDTWGEAVHAVVVLPAEGAVTSDELREHLLERIANYKVPKTFELRTDPLPLSGAMKILKRELRAQRLEQLASEPAD